MAFVELSMLEQRYLVREVLDTGATVNDVAACSWCEPKDSPIHSWFAMPTMGSGHRPSRVRSRTAVRTRSRPSLSGHDLQEDRESPFQARPGEYRLAYAMTRGWPVCSLYCRTNAEPLRAMSS
jgi:hypothetical protein